MLFPSISSCIKVDFIHKQQILLIEQLKVNNMQLYSLIKTGDHLGYQHLRRDKYFDI